MGAIVAQKSEVYMRNITSITNKNLFTRNTKGTDVQYHIPREVALVVAQSLYGTARVPNNCSSAGLQSILDKAYDKREFSYRVIVG